MKMKRILAILLAVAMLLSFASLTACGEKNEETVTAADAEETETEATDTENDGEITMEMLEASKPNEYVKEKLEAGMTVTVACDALMDAYFVATQLFGGVQAKLEEYGIAYRYLCANANMADQISQIETLVTEKVNGIVIQTTDPASLQTSIEAAQDAGICVVVYGIDVEYPTIVSTVDNYTCGLGAAAMASAWVDEKYPDAGEGEIKAAITGSKSMPPLLEMYSGFEDGLAADSRFNVVFQDDDTIEVEDGYNTAQNALMYDPEIRVFVSYQMSAALGINNYLEASGADMTEFGIFTTSVDDSTESMLAAAAEGTGAIRGTISAGDDVSATTAKAIIGALFGEVSVGDRLVDPLVAMVSADYTCDWSAYVD